MIPKLEKPLRREVELEGKPYIVTIGAEGVRIIEKGKRTGAQEITWWDLVSGDAALHRDLVRSLAHRKPPLRVVQGRQPSGVGRLKRKLRSPSGS